MKLNANNKGLAAEQLAETYLLKQGLSLKEKNYHCRYGEIDLIMQSDDTLVFVEVRLRKNKLFGSAIDSITAQKQQKLLRTAQHFLQQHGEQACRFDVIALSSLSISEVEWIQNAISL